MAQASMSEGGNQLPRHRLELFGLRTAGAAKTLTLQHVTTTVIVGHRFHLVLFVLHTGGQGAAVESPLSVLGAGSDIHHS